MPFKKIIKRFTKGNSSIVNNEPTKKPTKESKSLKQLNKTQDAEKKRCSMSSDELRFIIMGE